MRLGAKLTVTIALASVVPIVAAGLLGRELVQRRSRAEFARLLRDGKVEVKDRYRHLQEDVCRSVERLANPEDMFLGLILMAQAQGGADASTHRKLAEVAPRVMEGRGLDALSVLGPRGKILASGHFPGRLGDTEPRYRRKAKTYARSGALLQKERVLKKGKLTTLLTVQAWREVSSPLGVRVVVVGGKRLGPALLRGLTLRGGTVVRIQDSQGKTLAGPADWTAYARFPKQVVSLPDPGGAEAARVTLAVPDHTLRTTLQAINYTAGALVGSGLLLALLLGFITARRITYPIREVVRGASAVAAGDLDVRLDVKRKDELGELVAVFNRRVAELKEAREKLVAAERVAAWQEIARRIAHEIKNPLFPIQTSMETLRKVYANNHPDFDEIFDESTNTILEEVNRLKNIVTEFSQFARLPKPQLELCDVGELIRSTAGLYGDGAVPMECSVAEDLPLALADREQMTQVLVNLIQNARDALVDTPSPSVQIQAAAADEWVEISVRDNGPGFGEEVGARLFTPYFTTRHGAGGTGLGLAIVHRIITDHGGSIEARSLEEGGALFRLRVRRAGVGQTAPDGSEA